MDPQIPILTGSADTCNVLDQRKQGKSWLGLA